VSFLGWAPRSEYDVEDKIKSVLERFVGQKFNGVTITRVQRQYEVEGRRADIAVLKDNGNPLLIIETKKKKERGGSWSVERHFIPTSEDVVGQAASYAALLKRNKEVYVPFIATANETQLALFKVPENIEYLVNWDAISERNYGRVIKDFYEFKKENLILHRPHGPFSEEFFKGLLDTITGIYVKKYSFEEKRQELHWQVLEDLRSFVDFLTPFVEQAIAEKGRFKDSIASKLEEYRKKTGYNPTPQQLAREMAYVLLNKILFYKVLEHYYNLPSLGPLYEKGVVKTCSEYLKRLREYFVNAVEVTRDFQTVFETGIYDEVDLVENEGVLKAIDWLINLVEHYQIERLGDVIGFIYEDLIPGEERHQLGQFYTPKPIAELIVKWSVRSPDDKVLDPGCGSGTFLVEAYKRLAELKLKNPWSEIEYVPSDVHRQILRQLYGVDINEFPAHLTAMNLAMKNVRAPSPEMYVFVRDYFTIMPGQQVLTPYEVRTAEGGKPVEVVFKDFDAVVGNPPYTRWSEMSEKTREIIQKLYDDTLRNYKLRKFVTGGAIPGIFVPWIFHSVNFLREGGRLGMIISDSWLGADYGIGFLKYLADNFKIIAIIDLAERVFERALIGSSIILLEKSSNKNERDANTIAFIYIKKQYDVDAILETVESARKGKIKPREGIIINVIKQGELYERLTKGEVKPIALFFEGVEGIIKAIASSGKAAKIGDVFQPSEGNTGWSVYASMEGRGAGVGGEEFYYLAEDKVKQFNLDKYVGTYLKPLISSPDRLKFFTFTMKDWKEKKEYILIANAPFTQLPPEVQKYIKLGETSILLTKGPNKGKPVSESTVAKERKRLGTVNILGRSITFYDWYDLGGVVEAPIYVARGTQYWIRFTLAKFQSALDDRVLALIPRQGVQFDEVELKALLAYLNSSFTQIQAEVSRSTPGGMTELDVKPLGDFLILDVKKLPRGDVEKLAHLFDKLEAEARRLGGANVAENVFGSELAKELPSKSNVNVKPGVEGLFNTVIREIDYEVARVLGLENLVEPVRAMVLEMARRRLSRAGEAKREAVKGTEESLEPREPKRRRGRRRGEAGGEGVIHRRLDEFM
jgi:type I restriction-modification system DNA methylase subunit